MNTDHTDKTKKLLFLKIHKICVDLCPNVFGVLSSQEAGWLIHHSASPAHGGC